MGNELFRDDIKPLLDKGEFNFIKIMPEGGDRLHDGTNLSNEIGIWEREGIQVLQKVMLTSIKYHQRRKALTEMVSAWLDEGLGPPLIVPSTYAEIFSRTDSYRTIWGDKPKDSSRARVCQVVHVYYDSAMPGDEWRGAVYQELGDLEKADEYCRNVIENNIEAEKMALLDFLTINQDRSARNWLTDGRGRFYAIDNGMAWFHEYPHSEAWEVGCVIDDVLLQRKPWQFISGIFTTSYAGRKLSASLVEQLHVFNWSLFCKNLDMSCQWLGISLLSLDWRFLGLRRRLEWIKDKGRFPTTGEYRGWFNDGSELFTPPEIIASGGEIVWEMVEDKP